MKKISLFLVIISSIALAWCHNPSKNVLNKEPIKWDLLSTEAAQICEEMGWDIVYDWLKNSTPMCYFLETEWCSFASIEEWDCERLFSKKIETSNFLKTGLTNQDLIELAITHFPKSYTYYVWDSRNQSAIYETWEFVYPEDYHHYQNMLIPELNWMVDAEVVEPYIYNANIDGKSAIVTSRIVYLEDGSKIHVDYFNDSETLNFDNLRVFYWEDDNRFKVYKFYY